MKFEQNTTYTTNFLYDHTIKLEMQVLYRTEKTVRVVVEMLSNNGKELPCEIATKRVAIDDNGNEYIIFDNGVVFRADRFSLKANDEITYTRRVNKRRDLIA